MEVEMFRDQHRQQQVRKLQYIRYGSLSLRILPGTYGGQSSHPLQNWMLWIEVEVCGGQHRQQQVLSSIDKTKYWDGSPEVTVYPIRKFISSDIAMYWRPILSSPTSKTEYCEWRWRCLGTSTDSSRYRSHSTVHPIRKYISPDIARYSVFGAKPLIHF